MGGSLTCTGSYTVTQADIDNDGGGDGDIDNVATADSNETGPDTDDETVPVLSSPGLNLDKTGVFNGGTDGFADVGDLITYTFVVTNTGNTTLHNVSVTDPKVPVITCPGGNPIPSLAVGASVTCTGTYAITQADIDAGSVYNLAIADSDETPPDEDDNTELLPRRLVVTKTVSGHYDRTYLWKIEKSVDKSYVEAFVGETVTFNYTVAVTPDGYEDSGWTMGGIITVSNPNTFQAITASVTDVYSGGGSCTVTGGSSVNVPAGGSVNLNYSCTFTTQPAYTGTNTATASWAAVGIIPAGSATGEKRWIT